MISWSLPFVGIVAGASINALAKEREGAPSFSLSFLDHF
jgi:hypothetical protein